MSKDKIQQYLLYLHRLGYGHYSVDIMDNLRKDIYADKPDNVYQKFIIYWEKFFLSRIKELEPLTYEEWDRELRINEILDDN